MKKTLIALLLLMIPVLSFGADINMVTEIGSMTVDGGSSHLTTAGGIEISLKTTESGFVNKIRTVYYQTRNMAPEVQGVSIWDITQQTLKKDWWGLYGAIGFGGENQIRDGDDYLSGGGMIEFGAKLFNKMPFGAGFKWMPKDDRGDRVLLYGTLSIRIP